VDSIADTNTDDQQSSDEQYDLGNTHQGLACSVKENKKATRNSGLARENGSMNNGRYLTRRTKFVLIWDSYIPQDFTITYQRVHHIFAER
jgi:exonuclease III